MGRPSASVSSAKGCGSASEAGGGSSGPLRPHADRPAASASSSALTAATRRTGWCKRLTGYSRDRPDIQQIDCGKREAPELAPRILAVTFFTKPFQPLLGLAPDVGRRGAA